MYTTGTCGVDRDVPRGLICTSSLRVSARRARFGLTQQLDGGGELGQQVVRGAAQRIHQIFAAAHAPLVQALLLGKFAQVENMETW